MTGQSRRGVIRCLHWSDERQRTYGWHHHDGPHACDSGNHDGHCPWRAQMFGPGFEEAGNMTSAVNRAVEGMK